MRSNSPSWNGTSPEEQAWSFHHTAPELLFMSAREGQYIQRVVAFLTTCVKKPDKDKWIKLNHLLKYIKVTRKLKLTLIVGDISVVKWLIYASDVVQEDCQGHTGAMMSLGKGEVHKFSKIKG